MAEKRDIGQKEPVGYEGVVDSNAWPDFGGEQGALWWEQIKPELVKYISSNFRDITNSDLIDDILQSVYLKILKGHKSTRKEYAPMAWIYAILRNTLIDFFRKRKSNKANFHDPIDTTGGWRDFNLDPKLIYPAGLLESLMRQEKSTILDKIIEIMPEKQKIVLRYAMEHPDEDNKESAKKLMIPPGTFKSRLHRAKKFLGQQILTNPEFYRHLSSNDYSQ